MIRNLVSVAATSGLSSAGQNWHMRPSLAPNQWSSSTPMCLTWTGSNYLAGGGGTFSRFGTILFSSTDGAAWSFQPGLNSIFGGSACQELASNGSGRVVATSSNYHSAYSTDHGVTWAASTTLTFIPYTIIWNGTKFLAAGSGGMTATSTDGVTWTESPGLTPTSWGTSAVTLLAWSGTKFVAGSGGMRCATSTDGVTWTYQSGWQTATSRNMHGLTWTGTNFVGISSDGTVGTSTDGVSWTLQTSLRSSNWYINPAAAQYAYVMWSGTKLLALGVFGRLAISTDHGVNWTYYEYSGGPWLARDGHRFDTPVALLFANSRFVALYKMAESLGGHQGVLTSPGTGGLVWTYQESFSQCYSTLATDDCISLIASPKGLLAVGHAGRLSTSPDGTNWTYQPGLRLAMLGTNFNTSDYTSVSLVCGIWTGSQYLVGGVGGKIATSPDGVTWTNRTSNLFAAVPTGSQICSMLSFGSTILLGSTDGRICVSTDGAVTWATLSFTGWGAYTVWCLAKSPTTLLATGNGGRIATSADNGATWTDRTSNLTSALWPSNAAIYNAAWVPFLGKFFIYGTTGGNAYTALSPDGVTWTRYNGPSALASATSPYFATVVTSDKIVVGTEHSKIAYSYDGVNWSSPTQSLVTLDTWGSPKESPVTSLCWDGTKLLAGGKNGRLAISTN